MSDIRLLVMLECGHTLLHNAGRLDRVMDRLMLCEEDNANVRVWATECREWKLECKGCRYSRWFGASQDDCEHAVTLHTAKQPSHYVTWHFRIHPDKFRYVRQQLGRKAVVFIDDKPNLRVVVMHKIPDEECPF